MSVDPFTVTVRELREWLADLPDDARIVITPPEGRAFPLLGWAVSADRTRVLFTGAPGTFV